MLRGPEGYCREIVTVYPVYILSIFCRKCLGLQSIQSYPCQKAEPENPRFALEFSVSRRFLSRTRNETIARSCTAAHLPSMIKRALCHVIVGGTTLWSMTLRDLTKRAKGSLLSSSEKSWVWFDLRIPFQVSRVRTCSERPGALPFHFNFRPWGSANLTVLYNIVNIYSIECK